MGAAIWYQNKFTIFVFNEIWHDKCTFGEINVTLSGYIITPVPMLAVDIFLENSPFLFLMKFGDINLPLA